MPNGVGESDPIRRGLVAVYRRLLCCTRQPRQQARARVPAARPYSRTAGAGIDKRRGNLAPIKSGPGPAPAIRQEMGFENWPGGLRGLQSERARARSTWSHGPGVAYVTEITGFRFGGYRGEPAATSGRRKPLQRPSAHTLSPPAPETNPEFSAMNALH